MSDVNTAPGGDGEAVTVVPVSSEEPISARDAANAVVDFRRKRDAEARGEQPEAPAQAAEPEPLADEANANPPEEAPGEQTEAPEPAEEPPIEPPRSWTKEEKAEFATYPREAQEKIARREQDREAALRRGQNETADKLKGLTAREQQLEQARQQYEQALPVLLQTLQQQQQGEFSDIKTMADVEKLAREDWPRYALWDAQQKKIAAVTQEVTASQERQAQEYKTKWAEFASKEDAKFIELAPEMADKEKATKVADASVALLKDLGFSDQDLGKLWNGEASLSLRDHRAQLLIRDAARYREAQKAVKAPVKAVPQVQRPGVAKPKGADDDLRLKNLEQQLERTGNLRDAANFLVARRARQ